jgi:hypothetical protein
MILILWAVCTTEGGSSESVDGEDRESHFGKTCSRRVRDLMVLTFQAALKSPR